MKHTEFTDLELFQVDQNVYTTRPPLPKPEQQEAILLAQNGDQQSMELLIESNLPFIWRQARKYAGKGNWIDREDLIQSAILGFIEGVHKFDVSLGNALTTYVDWHIRKSVMDAMIHEDGRISRRDFDALGHLRKAKIQWEDANPEKGEPGFDDLRDRLPDHRDMGPQFYASLMGLLNPRSVVSLDRRMRDGVVDDADGSAIGDWMADDRAGVEDQVMADEGLREMLSRLSSTHRRLIEECVLKDPPLTTQQFAGTYGIPQRIVATHLRHAIQILKAHYQREAK